MYCGAADIAPPCDCRLIQCDQCGAEVGTKCDCRPAKRQKTDTDTEMLNVDITNTIEEIDPQTGEWRDQVVPRIPIREHDTCDMVLTKSIIQVRQLFNNYGKLSNDKLLSVYGFLDVDSETDTVGLSRELFTSRTSQTDIERREFWRDHGHTLLVEMLKHQPVDKLEMETLVEGISPPISGWEFILWSLTIIRGGFVRFPVKLWIGILLFTPVQWTQFKGMSMEGKVNSALDLTSIFHKEVMTEEEVNRYDNWLQILGDAVRQRLARYPTGVPAGTALNAPTIWTANSDECFKKAALYRDMGVCYHMNWADE